MKISNCITNRPETNNINSSFTDTPLIKLPPETDFFKEEPLK